jgi:hypothetical protein
MNADQKAHVATIDTALRSARSHVMLYRYGGALQLYHEIRDALRALDELKDSLEPQQLTLEETSQ